MDQITCELTGVPLSEGEWCEECREHEGCHIHHQPDKEGTNVTLAVHYDPAPEVEANWRQLWDFLLARARARVASARRSND